MASDQPAPGSDQSRPASDRPAEAANQPAAAGDEPTPAGDEPTRASDFAARLRDNPKPGGEEPTPAGNKGPLASDKPAPRADAAGSASEQPTTPSDVRLPAVNEGLPTGDVRLPAGHEAALGRDEAALVRAEALPGEHELVTVGELPAAPAEEPARRRRGLPVVWLWLASALLLAAALGLWFGMSLGSRDQAPPREATSRPTLVIAEPRPSLAPSSTPVATGLPTTPEEYVVQAGDTLRSIASQRYGDSEQWSKIYQANRALIGPNPDALQPGMRLRIPPG